jgi:hypothetical protein
VGGPFYQAGIPEIGAIAGPEYLLTVSANGEMDKFDERLAAKQIAFLADLTVALDPVDAGELRAGDPTLGSPAPKGNIEASSATPRPEACGPARRAAQWNVRSFRRGRNGRYVVLALAFGGTMRGVTVELVRRGRVLARSNEVTVDAAGRRVVLRRHGEHGFPPGRYTVVVRHAGRVVARRPVRAK